ncbi:fused MFS/spermidine synthase [Porticoccaceae bacterium LTM1]|nr:fused MFS/spermidine synthase [Porticoccaceae bacterium LTM1]
MRLLLISLWLLIWSVDAAAEVIHQEKSLYRNLFVEEVEGIRCLKFRSRGGRESNQSCIVLEHPDLLALNYTRMAMGGLFLNPQPKKVLVIGLGGGILPRTLRDIFPNTKVTSVEIDPAVVKVAEKYFHFNSDENNIVVTQDARVFVKRAGLQNKKFDFIILDAFNGDYIPGHLMTLEFFQELRKILTPQGVLLANTFSRSELIDSEAATYHAAFGHFYLLTQSGLGNRILMMSNGDLPSKTDMYRNMVELAPMLEKYGVESAKLFNGINKKPDWDKSAKVLTDQYSPVNILNGR